MGPYRMAGCASTFAVWCEAGRLDACDVDLRLRTGLYCLPTCWRWRPRPGDPGAFEKLSLSSSLHACFFSTPMSQDGGTWLRFMLTSCSPRKRAVSATRRRRLGVSAMLTSGRKKQLRSRLVVREQPGGYPFGAGGPDLRTAQRPIPYTTPSAISSPFIARQLYSPFNAKNTPKAWKNMTRQPTKRWMR